jgi:hypothetical protein
MTKISSSARDQRRARKNPFPGGCSPSFVFRSSPSKPPRDRSSLVVQLHKLSAKFSHLPLRFLDVGRPFACVILLPAFDIAFGLLNATLFGLHFGAKYALLLLPIYVSVKWPWSHATRLTHPVFKFTPQSHISPFVVSTRVVGTLVITHFLLYVSGQLLPKVSGTCRWGNFEAGFGLVFFF